MTLYGSIDLTRLKELGAVKKVEKKDGTTGLYLNIRVVERKEPSRYNSTHFVAVNVPKEQRQEGVNYIIGDLKTAEPIVEVTPEEVEAAPTAEMEDLPF